MLKAVSIATFRTLGAAAILGLFALIALAPPARAASMSDYLENKIIDQLFRGQAYSFPTTIYFGLATTTGSDAACGTEVSGNNYGRASIASSLANWAGTQSAGSTVASTGTGGTTSNNITITWPTPSASWGTIVEVCAFDALTGGNMLFRNGLAVSKTINQSDVVDFPAGAVTFQTDN